MFRNDCFDMVVKIDERDIILSSVKSNDETHNYIDMLRKFYNIKETTIQAELFDITQYEHDEIVQIIPQEKKNKFEKNKYTILQIGV